MSDGVGMGMSFGFDTGDKGKRSTTGDDAPKLSSASGALTYDPLRLRILALANFRGNPAVRGAEILSLTDKSDLEALPGKLGVELFFDVEDLLRQDPKGIEVRYQPQTLSDLRPDAVAAGIPALDLIRKLLEELQAVEKGQMTASQFNSGLSLYAEIPALSEALHKAQAVLGSSPPSGGAPAAAASPAKPSPGAGDDPTVDSILAMVAAPGEDASAPPPKPKSSAMGGLVSAVASSARGGAPGGGAKNLGAARQAAQAVLARQLERVFQHPQFLQVESAWLGLKLLVDRVDMRKGVQVDVFDADPQAPAESFHTHVFPAEYEGRSEHPLSLTIVDFSFSNTAADQAALEQLAADAEQIQAPVVVSLRTDFLGVESMQALAGMDNARSLFETGFARWDAFRKTEPARWLAVTCNRMLLRAPYRAGSRRSSAYGEDATQPRWALPGWALGVTVARSHAELGWPTSIAGLTHGRIDDLPLLEGDNVHPGPLEAQLPQRVVEDLAEAGIIGLTHEQHRDAGLVIRTPTARALESGEPRERVNLAYQLFAARLGETVLRNKDRLTQGGSGADQLRQRFEGFLSGVVGGTGPGAGVKVDVQSGADGTMVHMTIRVGRAVLGGAELSLAVRA